MPEIYSLQSPKIIWTRAEEDLLEDRKLWQTEDLEVLPLPCFFTQPKPTQASPLDERGIVLVTSKKTSFYLGQNSWLREALRLHTFYTFGDATAKSLRLAGFQVIQASQAKSAQELCKMLLLKLKGDEPILVLGAEEPHFDAEGFFRKQGLRVQNLALYKTELSPPLEPEWQKALVGELRGLVCFASPSAVRGFIKLLNPRENRLGLELHALSIGPSTATLVPEHFKRHSLAPRQSVSALWAEARDLFARLSLSFLLGLFLLLGAATELRAYYWEGPIKADWELNRTGFLGIGISSLSETFREKWRLIRSDTGSFLVSPRARQSVHLVESPDRLYPEWIVLSEGAFAKLLGLPGLYEDEAKPTERRPLILLELGSHLGQSQDFILKLAKDEYSLISLSLGN